MILLSIKDLNKHYLELQVLDSICFEINKGEFVSIVGPNGCGKTTLLNLISDLDKSFEGRITYSDTPKFGFIFQNSNDSVLPWKTVMQNIYLDKKNLDKNKICQILNETNLWKFKDKHPYQLSGGMKQLLAISRAFIHNCNFLIFDEPFASLDYSMTIKVRANLLKLWEKERPTVLFISHNIEDAILLADRIIILSKRPGRIKETIKINLPRPRNNEMILSKQFLQYKKRILELIENENK